MNRCGKLLICLCAALTVAVATPRGEELLTGEALLSALRKGGYNIYFRHAQTDWSQDDYVAVEGDWTSCDPARIRQLAPQGRRTSRQIGAAMRALGIPVGKVLSSEYCRAEETAALMELGPVVKTRNIMNMRAAQFVGGSKAVIERARRLLAEPPRPGMNTVLVAHGNLLRDATGTYPDEGGAAIFAPDGKGGFRLVARLAPEDWEALARRFGKP